MGATLESRFPILCVGNHRVVALTQRTSAIYTSNTIHQTPQGLQIEYDDRIIEYMRDFNLDLQSASWNLTILDVYLKSFGE